MRDDLLLAKANRINLLLDFYGGLLTDKQKLFLQLQFHDDFSLREIAEQYDVSRQAVNEHIKRACDILETYETCLQLLVKHEQRVRLLNEIEATVRRTPIPEDTKEILLSQLVMIRSFDES